jgi:2-keto-4-pentenoate hydratase/2-oxohepta-3-ene-1,7-dioic acid hydratase in catechol pathway
MRIVSYGADLRAGVVAGGQVYDAGRLAGLKGRAALSTVDLLALGPSTLRRVGERVTSSRATAVGSEAEVPVGPPIPCPSKILCVGMNYRDHVAEGGHAPPRRPEIFAKFTNTLIGPGQPIKLPRNSDFVDYEAEVAIVIGTQCKDVSLNEARSYIAGLTILNDVSARDVQLATTQWTMGKSFDTFGPCGPAIASLDELGDLELDIQLTLNGNVKQRSNTRNLIFGIDYLVTYISSVMTLNVGDIIATGTPAGVGYYRQPPEALQSGDVVCIEVNRIGTLCNPVQ